MLLFAFITIATVVALYARVLHVTNPTIAALTFLLVVFGVAAQSTLRVAICCSLVATACLNFFFFPPTGTWWIGDPENWFALFTFLVASVGVSRLSSQARARLETRKEAELMRRSAEFRSTLLASLSHDLRTPLTAVTIASNNLDATALDESQRRDQVDVIRTEVSRLNRLFENIVEMARIETRAIAAEPQWVQPAEIIDTARHQVGRELTSHPVSVDVDERTAVKTDPRLASTALARLLENAARYSGGGTPIEIWASVDEGALQIRVRDHGPGIAPDEVHRVFERFYRGASAQHHFGTGMGLAIAKGLLEAQNGTVWAENHPERGAIFTLAIPVESRALVHILDEELT